jgi:hypothetical protein
MCDITPSYSNCLLTATGEVKCFFNATNCPPCQCTGLGEPIDPVTIAHPDSPVTFRHDHPHAHATGLHTAHANHVPHPDDFIVVEGLDGRARRIRRRQAQRRKKTKEVGRLVRLCDKRCTKCSACKKQHGADHPKCVRFCKRCEQCQRMN